MVDRNVRVIIRASPYDSLWFTLDPSKKLHSLLHSVESHRHIQFIMRIRSNMVSKKKVDGVHKKISLLKRPFQIIFFNCGDLNQTCTIYYVLLASMARIKKGEYFVVYDRKVVATKAGSQPRAFSHSSYAVGWSNFHK